jgi:hypothetical protein
VGRVPAWRLLLLLLLWAACCQPLHAKAQTISRDRQLFVEECVCEGRVSSVTAPGQHQGSKSTGLGITLNRFKAGRRDSTSGATKVEPAGGNACRPLLPCRARTGWQQPVVQQLVHVT